MLGFELLFAWILMEARGSPMPTNRLLNLLALCASPFVFTGIAWWLAHRPRFWAQLTSRAIFWSLGLLIVAGQSSALRLYTMSKPEMLTLLVPSAVMLCTIASVAVLLKLGDHGLRPPQRTTFEPVAHRELLTLSLMMGLADAVILTIVGLGSLTDPSLASAIRLGLASLLMVSAWSLSRLRVWGLGAMALGNLFEVFVIGTGAFDSLGPLLFVLLATAAVQLLLPVPVYGAMLRPASKQRAPSRLLQLVLRTVLIGAALFSVAEFLYSMVCLFS